MSKPRSDINGGI